MTLIKSKGNSYFLCFLASDIIGERQVNFFPQPVPALLPSCWGTLGHNLHFLRGQGTVLYLELLPLKQASSVMLNSLSLGHSFSSFRWAPSFLFRLYPLVFKLFGLTLLALCVWVWCRAVMSFPLLAFRLLHIEQKCCWEKSARVSSQMVEVPFEMLSP